MLRLVACDLRGVRPRCFVCDIRTCFFEVEFFAWRSGGALLAFHGTEGSAQSPCSRRSRRGVVIRGVWCIKCGRSCLIVLVGWRFRAMVMSRLVRAMPWPPQPRSLSQRCCPALSLFAACLLSLLCSSTDLVILKRCSVKFVLVPKLDPYFGLDELAGHWAIPWPRSSFAHACLGSRDGRPASWVRGVRDGRRRVPLRDFIPASCHLLPVRLMALV